MTVVIPASGILTQTYSITTDFTKTDPSIICNFKATLSPTAVYIALSPDSLTILLDQSKIVLPTDIGIHTFSITINSLEFYATVPPKILTFFVKIECTIT